MMLETGDLDPQYECPICLSCLKEPLLTSCGHRFCASCLNAWLESKGACCPVDGAPLDRKSDLFPDHFTRREILSRRTVCQTCKMEIGLSELEEHMSNHAVAAKKMEDVSDGRCPFKWVGCEFEGTKDTLSDHLMQDIHAHLKLLATSHINLKDKLKYSDKMSEVLAQETIMWEPQDKKKEQNTLLMRALYERVVVLEQRCHEQNAQIQKLKSQVQNAESKIREVSLEHSCGQYLWRITDFSQKMAAMKSGEKRLYFSEGFYTSPIGYKFCGRINLSPNNGDQLSLLVHLMRTSHDCTLDWPFTGRIHLAAIHPSDPEGSVKETMMTRPDLDSFKRPSRDMNTKAFGYPHFISINDIFKNGFLVNDTLLVKIHIQAV